MATDKVTITLSPLENQVMSIASGKRPDGAPQQVDMFVAAEPHTSAAATTQAQAVITAAIAPQGSAATPEASKKPWELSTEQAKGLNFQPDSLLHAKMNWVCDNVPRMSRLRILRDGAMAECDRLIALHYKDDPKAFFDGSEDLARREGPRHSISLAVAFATAAASYHN